MSKSGKAIRFGFGAGGGGASFVAPKPTLQWYTTGKFRITNFNPDFRYTFSNVSGGGSLTQEGDGSILYLSASNSAWNVYAWGPKSVNPSPAGYCERKARTSVWVFIRRDCWTCNCRPNCRADCNINPWDPMWGGAVCPWWCPCYDGNQNRCICWVCGPDYCDTCCTDVYGWQDQDWSGSGYTDQGTEWSKTA